MNKIIMTLIALSACVISSAQLHIVTDLGFMRSVNRYDESGDPENSMSPLNVNPLMGSIRINYDFGKYFNAGLQLMIQKQNVEVGCNLQARPYSYPKSRQIAYNHYFMVGPEFNLQMPMGNFVTFQVGSSFLFYDNRQMTPVFERDLIQQSTKNYDYQNVTPTPYIYSSDAEFLNGWNMKISASFRFIVAPLKNKSHTMSVGFSTGRSLKQNYAVNYRTNKYDSQTETNVVQVRNYGEYYGINLGYGYRFDFKRD